MNKQEYILELINKGYSDEEIELLVKDKFPEEEIIPFMPASPSNVQSISSSEYQTISFSQGGKNPGGENTGYTPDVITIRKYNKDVNFNTNEPIKLELKYDSDITIATNDLTIIVNDVNFGSQTFTFKTVTKPITLTKNGVYTFNNNADPVPSSSGSSLTPQEAFDQTWDIMKTVGEKASRHGVTNITDLETGDAIYNYVEKGKIYFMAVDHNKQYLMQGLCISKDASTATFVGYSWNTQVKHTNTVWATASKGSTSGDTLSFNGVDVNDLKNDDNALANVALVKDLVSSAGGGESWKDITSTYQTKVWTLDDFGKQIRISANGDFISGIINIVNNTGHGIVASMSSTREMKWEEGLKSMSTQTFHYNTQLDKNSLIRYDSIITSGDPVMSIISTSTIPITKFEIKE